MKEPHLFAGNPLDREGRRRRDAEWIADRLEDPTSRFLVLAQLEVLVTKGDEPRLAWARGDVRESVERDVEPVLLGTRDGVAHFALDLSSLQQPLAALGVEGVAEFSEVRGIASRLPAEETAIVAQARSYVDWHARHRFCAVCGEPTVSTDGGVSRGCRDCRAEHFPRTDPVAIMLVARGDRCLLGRQSTWPPAMFSALAGFIEPGETLEEAVRREVHEEAGIRVGAVRYHSSQPWPFPSSLMIGCVADATTEDVDVDTGELEEARWFAREDVRKAIESPGSTDALFLPPPMAIARHLVKAWALREA